MAVICAVTFMGCEKDEQESFKFDIENLYGTWQGIAIQSNGEWIDITQPPHTNLAFSVVFYENGTYSGSGYFGNGSGTYKAEGDMIYTYIDGEELYRYKVHSISNGIAEVSMGVAGDNITLEIKLQKSNQIGYMFQNKGENKSRLCYSLQNHYICIAKSNAIQTYPTILGICIYNLTASSSVAETPDGLHFEPSNS